MRSDVRASYRPARNLIVPFVLAVALLCAGLLACANGHGGGTVLSAESTFDGNCADAIDNDGDGLVDGADPNCGDEMAGNGNCADGVDNDGDSETDCIGGSDADCTCGPELFGVNCADGIDNDDDGSIDGADAGCACPDADADGVCDAADACPGTPAGCTPDGTGCTTDADGDGVCDGLDACPGTDPACAVDAAGCPTIDTDGDGVCDGLDACPATPAGCLPVDAAGCPIGPCGNCSEDFAGGQADMTACYRDPSVQQGGCGGPFRLFIYVDVEGGFLMITVDTQDNPGGGGAQDPGIATQPCAADCAGDPMTFTCDVVDENGVTRTLTASITGGDIVGTIETTCGTVVDFSAGPRPDAECTAP